jgi:hypothetical protein
MPPERRSSHESLSVPPSVTSASENDANDVVDDLDEPQAKQETAATQENKVYAAAAVAQNV